MPSGPASLLRTTALGARAKAQLAKLLALLPRLDATAAAGRSVDEWIDGPDLRPDAATVLRALVRIGTYAAAFDELSAEAAITQLQRATNGGVLYLDGGWSQLIDGLAANLRIERGAVRSVEADGRTVRAVTDDGTITARAAVLAAGTPAAAAVLLPSGVAPPWGDIGEPVVAACLDSGVRRVPSPGYVLGLEEPVYATTQSPPARQAPDGAAVVSVLRYGTRSAELDRPQMEGFLARAGVDLERDVAAQRFLARMVVAGAMPLARTGGFAGRPAVDVLDDDLPGVLLAGDWVGRDGLLADAALASGAAAGRAAAERATRVRTPSMVA
jgi:hypothetical protein